MTARGFRKKIFRAFSIRSIRRSGRGAGTGLGLSICKSVMKEHHGSVEAANSPEGGAVFTVTLPVAGVN